jgi:hypothetical protein
LLASVRPQPVSMSPNAAGSSQGIDAGKVKDRKRHIAFGVLGLLLVVLVSAAGMAASRLRWSARSLGRNGVHAATETVDAATHIRKRAYESNAP